MDGWINASKSSFHVLQLLIKFLANHIHFINLISVLLSFNLILKAFLCQLSDLDFIILCIECLSLFIFQSNSQSFDFSWKSLNLYSLEHNNKINSTWEIFFLITRQVLNSWSILKTYLLSHFEIAFIVCGRNKGTPIVDKLWAT